MPHLDRRSFIRGAAALLAAPALAAWANAAHAPIALAAVRRTIEVNGKPASVLGLSGPNGFSGLRLSKGQRFRLRLSNDLPEPALVHWHGQTPPSGQDGVPGLSQAPLKPGEAYGYDFADLRAGTHWMHSHVGLQEQLLLAAPLIVADAEDAKADEQEHVVMLHDFTFRDPHEILAELKAGKGAHAAHSMEGMDLATASITPPAQINDVAFDAFLANERTLADPEIVPVENGGRIRLRIINAAAASNMWIDLGALQGELIAVDGNPVEPVLGSLFPLAVAQRADIRLTLPGGEGAWPVLFRPEGLSTRTGLMLATSAAPIAKIATEGEAVAQAFDLAFEATLRAIDPLAPEPVTRTEMVMLTGGGPDYSWGLNGKPSQHATLFTVKPGERVEIMLHNMTTMAHPMHLHGHHFQIVAIGGRHIRGAMRDTVLVPPNAAVAIAFQADNPGNWAFHCHHLYHMNAGMMGAVAYRSAA